MLPKRNFGDEDFFSLISNYPPQPHSTLPCIYLPYSFHSFKPERAPFALGVWQYQQNSYVFPLVDASFPGHVVYDGLMHPSIIGKWIIWESFSWNSNPPSWAEPCTEYLLSIVNSLESCPSLFPGGLDRDPRFCGNKPLSRLLIYAAYYTTSQLQA